MQLFLDDFDYQLPQHLIAQYPLPERSASRLLIVDHEQLTDRHFCDLPDYLRSDDLLVFNDSRVIHARLFGVKESGGKIEVLIERFIGTHEALAMIRASKSPKEGSRLHLADSFTVTVLGRSGEFFHLAFPPDQDMAALVEQHGHLPLPPYIQRDAARHDETRYQTIYARHNGSVAAPTAGLHFDDSLLTGIAKKGVNHAWVTLHVGAGTFQPVRENDLGRHIMHQESYVIPQQTIDAVQRARRNGGRVIAVGTTSARALESASQHGTLQPGAGNTRLFITPGYTFHTVDALITNFHLPRSTLLMLVSALAGVDTIRGAYAHAIAASYRFFSYGDAMFITGRPS